MPMPLVHNYSSITNKRIRDSEVSEPQDLKNSELRSLNVSQGASCLTLLRAVQTKL
jgi:hypothetical protein